jgi:hypothetical protein
VGGWGGGDRKARGEDRRQKAVKENETGGGRERGHEARERETQFGWWRQEAKGGDRRRKV